MPLYSCCMLGFVPPIAIAAKSRTKSAAMWAAGFTGTYLLGFMLIVSQPTEAENWVTNLGAAAIFIVGIGGATYAAVAGAHLDWGQRPQPTPVARYYAPPPQPIQPPMPIAPVQPRDPNADAIAEATRARQLRAEARAYAEREPLLARDLRIGRPDLPRQYEDGGLVDVNSAPAETMAKWLGISESQARDIAGSRSTLGRFQNAEDLVVLAGLDQATFDACRDRFVLL